MSNFNPLEFSHQTSVKLPKYRLLRKMHPPGAKWFHVDRRADAET